MNFDRSVIPRHAKLMRKQLNGLPDSLITGRPLTSTRRSVGVGVGGVILTHKCRQIV